VAACMTALALPALVSASSTTVSGVIPRALPFNINGSTGTWYVNESGVLLQDVSQWSPAKDVTVNISAGTALLGPDSKPIDEFTVSAVSSPPAPPAGSHILAAFDFKPDGATFYPTGIQISIKFDPSKVPAGEVVVIAFYNASAGAWQYIAGIVNSDNTAVFTVYHFTIYGVLSQMEPTSPPYNPGGVNYGPMLTSVPGATEPAPTTAPSETSSAQEPAPSATSMPSGSTSGGAPEPTSEAENDGEEEQMKSPNLATPTPVPTMIAAIIFGSGFHHHHHWLWLLLVIIWSLVVVLWLWIIFVVLRRYRYQHDRAGR
jgi:hypothetical protein